MGCTSKCDVPPNFLRTLHGTPGGQDHLWTFAYGANMGSVTGVVPVEMDVKLSESFDECVML